MTQVLKQFIELDDVIALRVECSHCKASLTLPLNSVSFKIPQMCPSCQSDWYEGYGNGRNMGDVIASFVAEVKRLRRALEDKSPVTLGFTLDLEVSGLSGARALGDRD